MKLCPQCDFIYEDDQAFCDMDGKELIFNAVAPLVDQNSASAKPRGLEKSRTRRFAFALAAAALVASLLSFIYLAQRRQLQNSAPSVQLTTRPALSEPIAQSSPAASIANMVIDASLQAEPNANAGASPVSSSTAETNAESNAPARGLEASTHAKDAVLASGLAPVILRLANGAVIKADDAGQTKNGVWYRQGGMVTFLKRGQVKTIERRPAPLPRTTKPADKVEKTETAGAVVAQNRLRLKRLEPATPKAPSRVASFFKKTGQILSKPFKR